MTSRLLIWWKLIAGEKLTFWKAVFWTLLALGLFATISRYALGLGAVTNLSDTFPWGFWIGVDILCGVGLAAGGFVVAASVYIFNLEEYRPILRPAILTAFLGYVLVIVALLIDLGKPWNLWHPFIMYNPRSVMFEVAWCVILYTLVLGLEFSPMVFEKLNLKRPQQILHAITIPLVILGVILSSLHQSSLGSMFLIVPGKLHPLWYASTLPYLFFLSAVAAGPAMVMIESYYSSRTFKREIEIHLLSKLGRVSAVALAVYLVLKVEHLIDNHLLGYLIQPTVETGMYWLEMLIGVLVPMVLLFNNRIRASKRGLFYASLCIVLGFVLNRLNVSLTGIAWSAEGTYFPSWQEFVISAMFVALGFAIFATAAKILPVFPREGNHLGTLSQRHAGGSRRDATTAAATLPKGTN